MAPSSAPPAAEDGGGSRASQKKAAMQRLKVALRIRPLSDAERKKGKKKIAQALDEKVVALSEVPKDKNDVLGQKRSGEKQFSFDLAFDGNVSQEEVYGKTTAELIPYVLSGHNATVFAYGATGSGKTFTMVGDAANPGIMIRSLNALFQKATDDGDKIDIFMSYLEIYNENIRDLLKPTSGHLDLREDARGGEIKVAGLSEVRASSTDEVMTLLQKGNLNRTVESTAVNKTSSRSHALLQVIIHKNRLEVGGELNQSGRLFMVDLAGSERASQTKNQGKRLVEGAHINRSLLALANCINALAKGDAKYVNFRDSKLTRLLKDALSGNCRTVMIAHVSPVDTVRDETYNTLVYADRAKMITNKVKKNVVNVEYQVSQYQSIINDLKTEIERLQDKVKKREDEGFDKVSEPVKEKREKLKKLQDELVELFRDQMAIRHEMLDLENNVLALTLEKEKQRMVIDDWEAKVIRDKKLKEIGANKKEGGDEDEGVDMEEPQSKKDSEADEDEEPDEVAQAWDEMRFINREQERYAELREELEKEFRQVKARTEEVESHLPSQIDTQEQQEVYELLVRVHQLEIERTEMLRDAIVRGHELHKRELLIARYDAQRNLCEQIITRQRQMLQANQGNMSDELETLYELYKQDYQGLSRESKAIMDQDFLGKNEGVQLTEIGRDDRLGLGLPPIRSTRSSSSSTPLFTKVTDGHPSSRRGSNASKPSTPPMRVTSGSSSSFLPPINSSRSDSRRSSSGRNPPEEPPAKKSSKNFLTPEGRESATNLRKVYSEDNLQAIHRKVKTKTEKEKQKAAGRSRRQSILDPGSQFNSVPVIR